MILIKQAIILGFLILNLIFLACKVAILMEYQTSLSSHEPIAITIGNFDGIHLGHQRLPHEVGELARTLQCKPVLVTFCPHTLLVVRPDIDMRYLTTQDEKL